MLKQYLIIFLILFLLGCSPSNEPVIQKADNEDPLVSTETGSTELPLQEKIMNISVNNKEVQLNIDEIPILSQYLLAVQNPNEIMEEMKGIPLPAQNQTLFLLEFACHHNLCSYILINEASVSSSFLVTDLAKYEQSLLSPNQTKLMIQFNRITSDEEERHHFVVIDTETSERIFPQPEAINNGNILNYSTSFENIEWLDEQTLSIHTTSTESVEPKPIYEKDIEGATIYTFHIP